MRTVLSGVFAAALLAVSACGDTQTPPEVPPAPVSPSPTSEPVPTPEPGERLTLEGIVQEGVEPNCLVLMAEQRQYLLLGGDDALQPGDRVVVQARAAPDQATTCMQGIPVEVIDARPA
ncbi:hypothetical protein [Prauserella shujinwangii]|uniref:hypothetical protein n=1 Tax=Prauserella shujinwangii TaxID=1453103 RepID=UPI000D058A80|nr:hypothetical protein [Prauserella shujinwangii]